MQGSRNSCSSILTCVRKASSRCSTCCVLSMKSRQRMATSAVKSRNSRGKPRTRRSCWRKPLERNRLLKRSELLVGVCKKARLALRSAGFFLGHCYHAFLCSWTPAVHRQVRQRAETLCFIQCSQRQNGTRIRGAEPGLRPASSGIISEQQTQTIRRWSKACADDGLSY